jgi:type I restriction enzyme S subunit
MSASARAAKLPGGFKTSDVGMIPSDWDVVQLGQLVSSIAYGSSAKSRLEGRVPVLRMGNLQGGRVVWDDLVFTDDQNEIDHYSLSPGDVLFNRTNTVDLVGKTALYLGDHPAIYAGYLIRVRTNRQKLDPRYLNYVLNAEFSRKYGLKVLSQAVGQANINGQKLKTYPIPLPPTKTEQDRIADALSEADARIGSLEKLLTKKRQMKQGAMQELLTRKRRLPGFSGEWAVRRIGQVAEVKTGPFGSALHERDYVDNGTPIITVEHLGESGVLHVNLPMVSEADRARLAAYSLRENDIVFSRVGSVDRNAIIRSEEAGWLFSGRLLRLRFDTQIVFAPYLSHYFHTEPFKERVRSVSVGQTMASLNTRIVSGYRVFELSERHHSST